MNASVSAKTRKPNSSPAKLQKVDPAFCKLMKDPKKLHSAKSADLVALTDWRSQMLTNRKSDIVEKCLNTCSEPSDEIRAFCEGLKNCQKTCITSKVIENNRCNNSQTCVQMGCSPMPSRLNQNQFSKKDNLIRSKIFIDIANKVVNEFISTQVDSLAYDLSDYYKTHFDFAKNFLAYKPNRETSYARFMAQTMRCLNNVENETLEPIMQHNSYSENDKSCGHAFGLGQVTPETFYSSFGIRTEGILSVQPFKNPCKKGLKEFAIKDLPRYCNKSNFQSQFYRLELFKKYAHLTPQQIHNLRAFDVELQIRLMLAVIVNKVIQTRNWKSAFVSYGNSSYAKYTGKNSCVQRYTFKNLNGS